jgi:hypothetical protein
MKEKILILTGAAAFVPDSATQAQRVIAPETVETNVTPQITVAHPTAAQHSSLLARLQLTHWIFIAGIDQVLNNHDFETSANDT